MQQRASTSKMKKIKIIGESYDSSLDEQLDSDWNPTAEN